MADELAASDRLSFLGTNETTGITVLDQDPQYIYIREDASGNYVKIKLDKDIYTDLITFKAATRLLTLI